jgi:hypothetical protein
MTGNLFWSYIFFGAITVSIAILYMKVDAMSDVLQRIDVRTERSLTVDKANGWVDLLERDLRAQLGEYSIQLPRIRSQ